MLTDQSNKFFSQNQELVLEAVDTGTEALFLASFEKRPHLCLSGHHECLIAVARR